MYAVKSMLAALGVLFEMQGIVRMMNGLCSGFVFEQRGQHGVIKELDGGSWRKKKLATAWWTTCRTLLSHRCWRFFPMLSVRLPEILLGGSFRGVKLQDDIFSEPGSKPAVGESRGPPLDKWKRSALRRQERFHHVAHALERLLHWARSERYEFMVRTMGVAPPRSKRVAQSLDNDLPCVDKAEESGVHALDEEEETFQEDSRPAQKSNRNCVKL